jgi:peptidoglycan/xylan/chitin deacetylase (PgdA/CDA1 family)
MGIGSHGIAHVKWPDLSAPALAQELAGSKQEIEAIIGQPVNTVGIPFGAWNRPVLRALRAAGYRAAYSSDRGTMDPTAFLRPRTSVRAEMTEAEIAAVLTGTMDMGRRLRRALGMLLRR